MKKLIVIGVILGSVVSINIRSAALCKAACNGDMQGVLHELNQGVDVDAPHGARGRTALHYALSRPDIVELLIMRGAAIDPVDERYGGTPLMRAAQIRFVDQRLKGVELLVRHKANVKFKNNLGSSIVDEARMNREHKLAQFLIDHGAKE